MGDCSASTASDVLPAQLRADFELSRAQELCSAIVQDNGYLAGRVLPDGSIAFLCELIFTRAICLGANAEGYAARFCFENRELATQRFRELLSETDEPAGFIARR